MISPLAADAVCALTVDGQAFTLPAYDIEHEQSFILAVPLIQLLNINTTVDPPAPVLRLLDRTPLLQRLTIDVSPGGDVESSRGVPDVLRRATYVANPSTFYIGAGTLPALRTLILRNAQVPLMGTLACTLRRLVLSGSSRFTRSLSLAQLLDTFKHFICLEHLEVRNYLVIPRQEDPQPLPVISFWSLKNFKSLVVQDDPRSVSKILSHLVVPIHVDVRAVANVAAELCPDQAGAILATMLPDHTWKLAAFPQSQIVALHDHPSHGCSLSAVANGRIVILELDTSPEGGSVPGRADGSLYKALIPSVAGIVPRDSVTSLVFSGPLAAVGMVSWVVAIEGFPNLHTIEVVNHTSWQEGSSVSGRTLLFALITPSRFRAGQVICPQLKSVTLKRFTFTPDFFVAVYNCFTQRIRLGAPRLESLVLELCSDPGGHWKSSEMEKYRPALNILAHDVILMYSQEGFSRTARLF
ncbi:hypothetical protein OH77DRAFT_1416940 [Trametes cingulata]|nr:hypothetical protein OH77DRAFT_1416940 [Trametes cingulata]